MASNVSVQKENMNANTSRGGALSSGELKMMLGQCLKMASENKITPHNTWGLPLIEHLDDLIKEEDPTKHTNFQRASVTLDAGVKIYSYRVDSVHTETFKMLGGLGRASGPGEEQENGELGEGEANGSPSKRKRRHGDLNPDATLEPTLESLNIKKFDLAFAVDPLFHKTSAQFDEGGAKGLLLNNLSVYRGCEIVFDSMDIPEAALCSTTALPLNAAAEAATISLDAISDQVAALLQTNSSCSQRISPTLDSILEQMGTTPSETAATDAEAFVRRVVAAASLPPRGEAARVAAHDGMDCDGAEASASGSPFAEAMHSNYGGNVSMPSGEDNVDDIFGSHPTDQENTEFVQAYDADGGDDGYGADYTQFEDHHGFDASYQGDGDMEDSTEREGAISGQGDGISSSFTRSQSGLDEDALSWLITASGNNHHHSMAGGNGAGYITASKGWAGASHWRYRAVPQGEDGDEEVDQGLSRKRKGGVRKRNDPLDFVALMQEPEPEFDIIARTTRRKTAKTVAKTLLPEDHHYQPEILGRYALRPRNFVSVPGQRQRHQHGSAHCYDNGVGGGDVSGNFNANMDDTFGNDDARDEGDDYYYGGDAGGGEDWGALGFGAGDDALDLVDAARKVEKVEVNYSRAAKQVDVRSLKELMWSGIHTVLDRRAKQGVMDGGEEEEPLEFADILATVPANNAAGRLEDLSVHLCFICVLHLANEHGLVIRGVNELDKLHVSHVPQLVN